jgi:energy-converting hydrogenase A subunit R
MKKVFISDCEGPISKNDNAYEITSQFIPNGNQLYAVISRYDDVLADVLKRPNYKAGSTLKLILPFLRAYDVTDRKMQEFSRARLALVAGARETIQNIRSKAYTFIVSTSYEHYIRALCQALDFPFENTYCTKVCIDKYRMMDLEKKHLRQFAEEIAQMHVINIRLGLECPQYFTSRDQETIQRLDEVFWKEILSSRSGRIYSDVDPMGANKKADAIEDVVEKVKTQLADVMYVGDSITDEEALQLVRKGDGLTISFNGNQYAVKNAEVAILSENSIPIAIIADVFSRSGKQKALKIAEDWNVKTLKSQVSPDLLESFLRFQDDKSWKVEVVTSENVEELARESNEFRRRVRGEAIGSLG